MIKYDTTDHRVEIQGSIGQLIPESIFLIYEIYNMILEDDADNASNAAEFYKKEMLNALPMVFISKDKLKKENERIEKENKERLEKLKDSLNKLGELLNILEEKDEDIRSADFDSEDEFSKWLHGDD